MNENMNFGGMGVWIFGLLILMMMGGGNFGWGNNRAPMGPPPATQESMTAGFNNQAVQNQLQAIAMATERNNYETARVVGQQTTELMQQNNTNLINAIQGFNAVNQAISNQTNVLSKQLMGLDAKMSSCCCEIKTMMLQNRLDETERRLNEANNNISNYNQSQYILGQLGRFVAWTPSGTQAAAVAGA